MLIQERGEPRAAYLHRKRMLVDTGTVSVARAWLKAGRADLALESIRTVVELESGDE